MRATPEGSTMRTAQRAISHRDPAAIRTDRQYPVSGDPTQLLARCRVDHDGRAESAGVQSASRPARTSPRRTPAARLRIETADIQIQEHRVFPRRLARGRRARATAIPSTRRALRTGSRRPSTRRLPPSYPAPRRSSRPSRPPSPTSSVRDPAEVAADLGAGVGCLAERDRPSDGVDRRRHHAS